MLRVRLDDLGVYVYARRPSGGNLVGILISPVEDCAVSPVLAAAVIGVILANFAVALAVFQALFNQCIQFKATEDVTCLVSRLGLVREVKSDWVP